MLYTNEDLQSEIKAIRNQDLKENPPAIIQPATRRKVFGVEETMMSNLSHSPQNIRGGVLIGKEKEGIAGCSQECRQALANTRAAVENSDDPRGSFNPEWKYYLASVLGKSRTK